MRSHDSSFDFSCFFYYERMESEAVSVKRIEIHLKVFSIQSETTENRLYLTDSRVQLKNVAFIELYIVILM